ncbi:hypothetical protein A3H89_05200 [Candidatus Amesbacteria bacterium RIFCSPLOWO2_02_FULL_48_11]|nr:MAG: hypothetical protein A3C34_03380 [Candidatus Amesbacteria bacterium RIFCSPHIGHO2_02_FULL_48_21]OGD07888.1 MAG: hypothetical protein A3B58_02950 [Candidatus Amesbacteria bacterium RIFCSPLOWO2_01_FULL_48_50]OGD08173.1 MAG: hypothetical protein A3H89_05200 [Candidatus Amesbacteria bacterium RIFCSPLOWO2_02_FULL_48_11]
MKIINLFLPVVDHFTKITLETGRIPAGTNGPYHDVETSVRNSSHWLITFSRVYKSTGRKKYQAAAKILADYLASPDVRPKGFTFACRTTPHKDKCNGLIGQAWAIEALCYSGRFLKKLQPSELARQVFRFHKFVPKYGLWHRREITGSDLSLDPTFNHHLWFAAAGSLLGDQIIREQVSCFLDHLDQNLTVLDNGLIFHPITRLLPRPIISLQPKDPPSHSQVDKFIIKSIGYHAYNLYAMALLYQKFPRHSFWKSAKFSRALAYSRSTRFVNDLKNNPYAYPYNPVGFEMPLVITTFYHGSGYSKSRLSQDWLNLQIQKCYRQGSPILDRNTADPITLSARIYELLRSGETV